MSAHDVNASGRRAVCEELARRGATGISEVKEHGRHRIIFVSKNGRSYSIRTRAKTSGTWQTQTTYGVQSGENPDESEFWVFVDLGYNPHKFYPVPVWWIENNIFEAHQAYLERHGGRRPGNDDSKHHAISVERIEEWEGQWEQLGL